MKVLPDVNLLLAFGWSSHPEHGRTRKWLSSLEFFATCPITELGFLRVSMSPGYRATFETANAVLSAIGQLESAVFFPDDQSALSISPVNRHQDTTDAYLVALAVAHECRLATLDEKLLGSPWARGAAFHPFH